MKTAQKSIWWKILRITGNLLYIVASLLFWVMMIFAFGFEAIDFGPDYIIPEGNGPNTYRDIFVMCDILVYPLLLFSLTNKLVSGRSKFMKGYSVFGILITLAEMGWVIFVPQYVAWYTVLLATVIIFAIRVLFHVIYHTLLRKIKYLYKIRYKKNIPSS